MSEYTIYLIVSFATGFFAGGAGLFLVSIYFAKKELKKSKAKASEFYKELDKVRDALKRATDVQERVNRVKDITKQQMDMQAQTEMPQKNSLDGHYKNGLTYKIRTLEEEKREILQSILDDGFDPEITTLNAESKMETMKLSEFMGNKGNTKSLDEPKPKSKAKLKLIRPEETQEDTL